MNKEIILRLSYVIFSIIICLFFLLVAFEIQNDTDDTVDIEDSGSENQKINQHNVTAEIKIESINPVSNYVNGTINIQHSSLYNVTRISIIDDNFGGMDAEATVSSNQNSEAVATFRIDMDTDEGYGKYAHSTSAFFPSTDVSVRLDGDNVSEKVVLSSGSGLSYEVGERDVIDIGVSELDEYVVVYDNNFVFVYEGSVILTSLSNRNSSDYTFVQTNGTEDLDAYSTAKYLESSLNGSSKDITGFALPSSATSSGGLAVDKELKSPSIKLSILDFKSDNEPSTLSHELVHTKQDYSMDTKMKWWTEGSAQYISTLLLADYNSQYLKAQNKIYLKNRSEHISRIIKDINTSNSVLANPDTWSNKTDYTIDYTRGLAVSYIIDKRLRNSSDGDYDITDLSTWMNTLGKSVSYEIFRSKIVNKTTARFGNKLDSYIFESEKIRFDKKEISIPRNTFTSISYNTTICRISPDNRTSINMMSGC